MYFLNILTNVYIWAESKIRSMEAGRKQHKCIHQTKQKKHFFGSRDIQDSHWTLNTWTSLWIIILFANAIRPFCMHISYEDLFIHLEVPHWFKYNVCSRFLSRANMCLMKGNNFVSMQTTKQQQKLAIQMFYGWAAIKESIQPVIFKAKYFLFISQWLWSIFKLIFYKLKGKW